MSELASGIANALGILVVLVGFAAYLTWIERRLLGFFQDRYGPNRVGPFGIFQVVADMIKILFKEDWIPPFADRAVFVLAPVIVMVALLIAFAVIPIAPGIGVVESQYRAAVLSRDDVARRLQHRAWGMGVEQQILAHGRRSGSRSDG